MPKKRIMHQSKANLRTHSSTEKVVRLKKSSLLLSVTLLKLTITKMTPKTKRSKKNRRMKYPSQQTSNRSKSLNSSIKCFRSVLKALPQATTLT